MAERRCVRIEVGFDGGQVMSALVAARRAPTSSSARSRAGGAASLALDAEDGRYTIALAPGRLREAVRDGSRRVGFGGRREQG